MYVDRNSAVISLTVWPCFITVEEMIAYFGQLRLLYITLGRNDLMRWGCEECKEDHLQMTNDESLSHTHTLTFCRTLLSPKPPSLLSSRPRIQAISPTFRQECRLSINIQTTAIWERNWALWHRTTFAYVSKLVWHGSVTFQRFILSVR